MPSNSNSLVRTMCCYLSVMVVWIVSVNELLAVKMPKRTAQDIDDALRRHSIVPQLVEQSPKHALEVAYGNKVVDFGNNFTESEIENDPTHVKWPAEKDSLYTLILTGPDVPTHDNPEDKECQHWIVTNIPGTDIASGYNLTEYKGILTFYEFGIHRLIFLVYKQPNKEPIKFKEERKDKKITVYLRAFFHFENFANKYGLGAPVAANYFLTQLNPYFHRKFTTMSWHVWIVGYMRAFFHTEVFVIKYQLGAPVAANFFLIHLSPRPYEDLSSVAAAQQGVNDKFKSPPLTSDGILSQIFHQYFR